jgi:hypothetical protein
MTLKRATVCLSTIILYETLYIKVDQNLYINKDKNLQFMKVWPLTCPY